MGISYRGFFLHRYRGAGCSHELLLRVWFPAYANADQGAEDAAWAFGESAARHLRGWWERYELARVCSAEHERSLVGEASDEDMEDGPLLGPGLRELEIWSAPLQAPYLRLATTPLENRHVVFLLTDEDGQGDLSAP